MAEWTQIRVIDLHLSDTPIRTPFALGVDLYVANSRLFLFSNRARNLIEPYVLSYKEISSLLLVSLAKLDVTALRNGTNYANKESIYFNAIL